MDVKSDSETSSIQDNINNIKANINDRFNQLLSLISELKAATQAAAFENLTTANRTDNRMANLADNIASYSS